MHIEYQNGTESAALRDDDDSPTRTMGISDRATRQTNGEEDRELCLS